MNKNAKCLIATAETNFGAGVEGHADFPPKVEMTISNKWTKLLQSLVGTEDVKYIAAVRCAMEQEQLFNDKSYATMKFALVKTLVKKQNKLCDDDSMDGPVCKRRTNIV